MNRQSKINHIVDLSIDEFYRNEKKQLLSYKDFFLLQLKLLKKRWLLFQAMILIFLYVIIWLEPSLLNYSSILGISSSLLIIFLIPELWRDRNAENIELMSTYYYTINHVYASKIIIFGLYDLIILSLFFVISAITTKMTLYMMIIQFLLPMIITACISFLILSSKKNFSSLGTICICLLFSFAWYLITSIDSIYTKISITLWIILLITAICFLIYSIKKLTTLNQFKQR